MQKFLYNNVLLNDLATWEINVDDSLEFIDNAAVASFEVGVFSPDVLVEKICLILLLAYCVHMSLRG